MSFNKTANLGIHIRLYNKARGGLDRLAGKLNRIRISSDKASKSYRDNFFQLGVAHGVLQNGMRILGGIRSTIDEYRNFEKAVGEVSTLVDTSKVSMEKYTKSIKDMSAAYGSLPTETAKGFYQTISGGYKKIAASSSVMNVGMKLAVGGVTDTKTAVHGLVTILNTWDLKAKDAGSVADALFVSMREGITTIGELSRYFGTASNFAAKAGVHYTEVAAAIAAMTTSGIKSPRAFRGMTAILAAVAKGTTRAVKTAKNLGISFDMASIKAMGFQKWLQHVQDKTGGLSRNISALFGRIQGIGAVFSLGSTRAKKYSKILKDMENREGEHEKAFAKMANTLDFQMKKMSASWSLMKIAIGGVLKVALIPLVRIFRVLVDGIRKFAEQHPKIAGMIGLLLSLAGAIIVVTAALKIFEITFKITMMEVKKAAIEALLAFMANPIVLALVAIVAAIYLVKAAYDANLGGFADALDSLLSPIKTVISALWEMARTGEVTGEKVKKLFDIPGAIRLVQVISWLRVAVINFSDGFREAWVFLDVFDPLIQSFEILGDTFSRVAKLWRAMWGFTDDPGSDNIIEAMKFLGLTVGFIVGAIVRGLSMIIGGIITLVGFVVETISAILSGVIAIVSGFIAIFNGKFEEGFKLILSGVTGLVVGIAMAIVNAFYNLFRNFLAIFGIELASFEEVIGDLIKYGGIAIKAVLGGLAYLVDKIVSGFTYVKDLAIDIWDAIIDGVNWVKDLFNSIFNKIGAGIDNLKERFVRFGNHMQSLGSILARPFKPLKEAIKWLVKKIEWIISKKDAVVGFAQKVNPVRLFKKALGGVSGIASSAVEDLASKREAPNRVQVRDMAGFEMDRVAAIPSTGMGQEVKRRETQIKVQNEHKIETKIYLDGNQVAKSVKTRLESMKENNLEGTNPVVSPA